jgi:4-nitrophenyl phosphatase
LAVRTFVFDLDGVVYRGNQPIPGAVDTIENLRRLGHQVYFFTNNSSRTRIDYLEKLTGMGITTDVDHIMTSSYATALYLVEQGAKGKSVYMIGREGVREALISVGMRIVADPEKEKVDYVVVGIDYDFDFHKLTDAQGAILNGAAFIGTNPDLTFPCEDGRITPGNGALLAAIQAATGVNPIVIGKPETPAMHEILELAHATPEDTIVVGDRLDTDILAGKHIGACTVLVLTGIAREEDLQSAPEDMKPDIVVNTLPDMINKLGL